METYQVQIIKIVDETDDIKTYYLEMPKGISWQEAAQMHVALPGFLDGETINKKWTRHFTISSLMAENCISFTTRFCPPLSDFKKKLKTYSVGDEVTLYSISNRLFLERQDETIVAISQGVAMSTVRPLIKAFLKDPTHVKGLTSINISRGNHFLFQKEFESKSRELSLYWLEHRRELVQLLEDQFIGDDFLYYIVGSDDFLQTVISLLKAKGIKGKKIRIDKKQNKIHELLNF